MTAQKSRSHIMLSGRKQTTDQNSTYGAETFITLMSIAIILDAMMVLFGIYQNLFDSNVATLLMAALLVNAAAAYLFVRSR